MTRSEWIQQAMLHIGTNQNSREDTIAAIVKTADALEKSGVAPWNNEPPKPLGVTPTPFNPLTAGWGERAYAIFCRNFRGDGYGYGGMSQVPPWVNLTDRARRSWEDVAATIRTEAGALDVGDKVTYLIETAVRAEREECAKIADSQVEQSLEAISVHTLVVARNIRDEIRRRT